jgi:glyceraldehyde 3-phosphate dehydrogenase
MDNNKLYEKELSFQADRRKAGVELIKIISDLWYDKSIELVLFRNQLIDKNVSDIINFHEYAGEFVQKPINIFDSVEIARSIQNLDLPPSRIDIGKLTYEFHLDDNKYNDSRAFVIDKLKNTKDFNPENSFAPFIHLIQLNVLSRKFRISKSTMTESIIEILQMIHSESVYAQQK